METYAERLKREGRHTMTNYDMDEMRRREQAKVVEEKEHEERNLAPADYVRTSYGMLGQTDIVAPEWNERRSDEDMTEKRAQFAQDLIDAEKDQTVTLDLDIADKDFVHLAKAAHERNITLNQLCVDVLTSSFNDLDYRFEHQTKPSVLKEY